MNRLFKYELKRFLFEKKIIILLLVTIILPIFAVNYAVNSSGEDSKMNSEIGAPVFYEGRQEKDEYDEWKERYKKEINEANNILKKYNYIEGKTFDYSKLSYEEADLVMSAALRKNHYELVLKNNIPPYDWRKVYLQEYSTEMQESYGNSKEVVKQREKINKKIEYLLKNPWKELLDGYTSIDTVLRMEDAPAEEFSISAEIQKLQRNHNQFLVDNNIEPNKYWKNWKYTLALQNLNYESSLVESDFGGSQGENYYTEDQVEVIKDKIEANEYAIINDVKPVYDGSGNYYLLSLDKWLLGILLVMILLFGINISTDIKEGTMKNLIMITGSKSKIIISKILFYLLVTLFSIIVFYGVIILSLKHQFDFGEAESVVVKVFDKFISINIYLVALIKYVLYVVPMLFWMLFVFFFVMFFESGEFAVGFSVVCIGAYEFLKIKFTEGVAYTWTKYIPMYNTEYGRYITMDIMYPFSDFYLSIVQYSIYIVILYIATRWCMEKYQG